MDRIVLVDGNSIMNRAFYGIMGSKMLMTQDGTYTNAVYGFLAILFKILEDLQPAYLAVSFDLKAPTARHKMYEGYKATRHGMPEELASQMPMIKQILQAMHITIIEKEGYEADDVLGTLAKRAEKEGLDVTILSGDRDTFQLTSDHIIVRIPRTKMGKTEVEDFDRNKIIETYGLEPIQLIEVKGLMGDSSDNIPGVPGIGEKTALMLIKEYGSIAHLYEQIEKEEASLVKGKTKEKLVEHKDLALLSRTLGTINLEVPIAETIKSMKRKEWDKEAVLEIFQALRFNRYIDRFHLREIGIQEKPIEEKDSAYEIQEISLPEDSTNLKEKIRKEQQFTYFFGKKEDKQSDKIIKKEITSISIVLGKNVYYSTMIDIPFLKELFEDTTISKIGFQCKEDYVLLRELGIAMKNITFDVEIAAYLLNPTTSHYPIKELAIQYLDWDIEAIKEQEANASQQMNLFQVAEETKQEEKEEETKYAYAISKLAQTLKVKLEQANAKTLFEQIEMPLVTVLAQMQYQGMYVDKTELEAFGQKLKEQLTVLTKEIYALAGEEFNINSTQQLGMILFEKLKLTTSKKNKKGYSTDVDALEKIKKEHPIVEKILEYRGLMKLNSTYVEGMIPYINEKTHRIHSYFHQTVTATGRISSTEPNLQNIPTRIDLGKQLRKVFKPAEGYLFIDADYSQIELRVLAHISQDEHMLEAFRNQEDIHKQAASKVLGIPITEVTKEQRSKAKAVNFGIVYGISDFGLAEQIGVSRKEAKQYIEQYLEKYSGIQKFMQDIVEKAKEEGYVETLFHRRRYIPELKSNNYMVRQFGSRVAMNTPIQGTAADIMKIAMVNLQEVLTKRNMQTKMVLQVHDELLLETKIEEKEEAKQLLKQCMENAITLSVPLEVEVSEATNWYEAK